MTEPMPAHIELCDRREYLRVKTADDPKLDAYNIDMYDLRWQVPPELIAQLEHAHGAVYEAENDILRHLLETGQIAPDRMSNNEFRERASQ